MLRLFALGFAAGAVYHAVGLARPAWTEPAPAWRHALFVAVNAAAAAGLLRYRPAFLLPFAGLVLQQVWSHGRYGWLVWRAQGRVDWASVAVLVFMPFLLVLLVRRGS